MSNEIQQKHCKVCSELKPRIQFGKFANGKNKRWVDGEGKQWSGLTCPDCHRKRSLVHMHNLRSRTAGHV